MSVIIDGSGNSVSADASGKINGATTLELQTGGTTKATLTQGGLLTVGNTQIETGSGFAGVNALNGAPLILYTNSTERARITSGGYFKASNTGSYISGATNFTGSLHVFLSDLNSETFDVGNSNTGSSVVNIYSYLQSGAAGKHYGAVLAGSVVYQVLANGNVQNTNNSYGAISDIKLKENITDATPKLASLNQLRVVNYNLKADESKLKQIGLIAQEVEQIFPGLVEETPDIDPETKEPNGEATKAVKYSVLVPMLLKSVQELSAQNAALESRLAALEAK